MRMSMPPTDRTLQYIVFELDESSAALTAGFTAELGGVILPVGDTLWSA